jgi:hypothetical protein
LRKTARFRLQLADKDAARDKAKVKVKVRVKVRACVVAIPLKRLSA